MLFACLLQTVLLRSLLRFFPPPMVVCVKDTDTCNSLSQLNDTKKVLPYSHCVGEMPHTIEHPPQKGEKMLMRVAVKAMIPESCMPTAKAPGKKYYGQSRNTNDTSFGAPPPLNSS